MAAVTALMEACPRQRNPWQSYARVSCISLTARQEVRTRSRASTRHKTGWQHSTVTPLSASARETISVHGVLRKRNYGMPQTPLAAISGMLTARGDALGGVVICACLRSPLPWPVSRLADQLSNLFQPVTSSVSTGRAPGSRPQQRRKPSCIVWNGRANRKRVVSGLWTLPSAAEVPRTRQESAG